MASHGDDVAQTFPVLAAVDIVESTCVDDAGAEVPRGDSGEVVVRGYNVMRGYLDDAAEKRLKARAGRHGRSLEAEAREGARRPPHIQLRQRGNGLQK